MKFGQSKGYNMTNILIEKFYTKCGEDTISRSFSTKNIFGSKVLYSLFLLNAM